MVNKKKLFLRSMNRVSKMQVTHLQDLVHFQNTMYLMDGMKTNFVKVKHLTLLVRRCQLKMLRYTQSGRLPMLSSLIT